MDVKKALHTEINIDTGLSALENSLTGPLPCPAWSPHSSEMDGIQLTGLSGQEHQTLGGRDEFMLDLLARPVPPNGAECDHTSASTLVDWLEAMQECARDIGMYPLICWFP
jgi:hypothetical protein